MPIKHGTVQSWLPVGKQGVAEISYYEIDENMEKFTKLRALVNNRPTEYCPMGKYTRLTIKGGIMMSDTLMEANTNKLAIAKSSGNVLIGGLGLGFVLKEILRKTTVKTVTVVEKYQDVIDLVTPHLDKKKLTIICGDILETTLPEEQKFDTIYFDIWPASGERENEEAEELKENFAKYLAPNGWMGHWDISSLLRRS